MTDKVSAQHKRVAQEVEQMLRVVTQGMMSQAIRDSHLKLWRAFADKWDLSRTRKPETWAAGVLYTFSRMVFGELSQTDVAELLGVAPATVGQKFFTMAQALDLRTLDARFVPADLRAEVQREKSSLPNGIPLTEFSLGMTNTPPVNPGARPDVPVSPQDLVYEGWEALDKSAGPADKKAAARFFHTALLLDPTLADAHNGLAYLAEMDDDLVEAERRYKKAYKVARENLGSESPDAFAWWSDISTRPYMRARYGLGWIYWQAGRLRKAIAEYETLLKLNPDDNQGVRYIIGPLYQLNGDLPDALRAYVHYARNYPGDVSDPHYLFSWGLALFQTGKLREALTKWRAGFFQNPYIAPLLLGAPLPHQDIWLFSNLSYPDYAQDYLDQFLVLWLRTPEALISLRALWTNPAIQADIKQWLKLGEELGRIARAARNRENEEAEARWRTLVDQQHQIETRPLSKAVIEQVISDPRGKRT